MFDPSPPASQQALFELGCWLRSQQYRHVCTTPATHQRQLERRPGDKARSLADAFGWNLPFAPGLLPEALRARLLPAGLVASSDGESLKSTVRFSTLDLGTATGLFCHSGFPTQAEDAVFFGPDSYRFAAAIARAMAAAPLPDGRGIRAVELCAGAGPGAWAIRQVVGAPGLAELLLTDLNPKALACATVNARLAAFDASDSSNAAGAPAALVAAEAALVNPPSPLLPRLELADLFGQAPGAFDLIVANPPYMLDAARRTYRHGGESLGTDLAVRIARESLARLTPGGCLVLYTGAPVVRGQDVLRQALQPLLAANGVGSDYQEIDPDVFGEELDQPAYAQVERIAAVSVVVRRAAAGS